MSTNTTYTPSYFGSTVEELLEEQKKQGGIPGALWGIAANNLNSGQKGTLQGWLDVLVGYLNEGIKWLMALAFPDSTTAEVTMGEKIKSATANYNQIAEKLQLPGIDVLMQEATLKNLRSFSGYAGFDKDPNTALSSVVSLQADLIKLIEPRILSVHGSRYTEAQRHQLAVAAAASVTGVNIDINTDPAKISDSMVASLAQLKTLQADHKITGGYAAMLLAAQTSVTAENSARGSFNPASVSLAIDTSILDNALRQPAPQASLPQLPTLSGQRLPVIDTAEIAVNLTPTGIYTNSLALS